MIYLFTITNTLVSGKYFYLDGAIFCSFYDISDKKFSWLEYHNDGYYRTLKCLTKEPIILDEVNIELKIDKSSDIYMMLNKLLEKHLLKISLDSI